jgi:hypothetical protein
MKNDQPTHMWQKIMGGLAALATIITLVTFFSGRMSFGDVLDLIFERGSTATPAPQPPLVESLPSVPPTPSETPRGVDETFAPGSRSMIAGAPLECSSLEVSESFSILCDGNAVTPSLLYFDEKKPQDADISPASPTRRFAILALCDEFWCDDMRLVDLKSGRLTHLSLSKYHSVEWIWWSSNESTAIVPQCHADFCELSAIALPTGAAKHLDESLGGNELHDVLLPSIKLSSDGCMLNAIVQRENEKQGQWISVPVC